MSPLIWAVLLLLIALALVVLEFFLPTGGILGIFAALAAGGAVLVAYIYGGLLVGAVFLAIVAIAVPALLAVAVQVWPHTPIGRSILISLPESEEDVLPESPERQHMKSLVGRRGLAKSDLLPSGAVLIDKTVYDAVSEGMAIERGEPVQVVALRMNCLVVRPAPIVDAETVSEPSEDPLAQSIDRLGLDPFDPLA